VRYAHEVVTPKYPLDPLRRVRAENVDQNTRALSEAVRHVEAARDEAERRERMKHELEDSLATIAGAERERLQRGELTVADAARGAAWGVAAQMQRVSQARAVDEAQTTYARAVSLATDRQKGLAEARASADLVEKHHRQWKQAREAEAIAKDEEDGEASQLALARTRGEK